MTKFIGTNGNDTANLGPLTGFTPNDTAAYQDSEGDIFICLAGNDTVAAFGGNDEVYGGDGTDNLIGNNGDDLLDGGEGNDTLNGGGNNDVIKGGAGDDFAVGGEGDDNMKGDAGNDELRGGTENDLLDGGAGADILSGGDGTDSLTGGLGQDLLQGDAGSDRFVFKSKLDSSKDFGSADVIMDFHSVTDFVGDPANQDKIDLKGLERAIHHQLHFISNPAKLGKGNGEFGVAYDSVKKVVMIDLNGHAGADFLIHLSQDVAALKAGDFIL
jgi:Ca2+-binding RTX toxin-like protein